MLSIFCRSCHLSSSASLRLSCSSAAVRSLSASWHFCLHVLASSSLAALAVLSHSAVSLPCCWLSRSCFSRYCTCLSRAATTFFSGSASSGWQRISADLLACSVRQGGAEVWKRARYLLCCMVGENKIRSMESHTQAGKAAEGGEDRRGAPEGEWGVRRVAVSYSAATIVLEYQVRATGKLYHHKMRLGAALSLSRDPAHLLAHLKLKHPAYFATAALKDAQLLKLIHKILARLPPQDPPQMRYFSQLKEEGEQREDLRVGQPVFRRETFLNYCLADEDESECSASWQLSEPQTH